MDKVCESESLIQDLRSRELVVQLTPESDLIEHLTERRTVYCGFDPTADSLHIGHLVPLLALARFVLCGHRAVALIGGATGLVGDPSFKAAERGVNSADLVASWAQKIEYQIRTLLERCVDSDVVVANNIAWFGDFNLLGFLRDVGKSFSVNAMMRKDSVKQRIEREGDGISFTEFSYMILQAYDFAELNRRFDCTIQIGGSDQWGNITCGIDLCRRQNKKEVHALTVPLVTKADGTKFGKSENGTVWLDAEKTSPYAFYQFWLNAHDSDVYRFLRYFTFIDLQEISLIEESDKARPGRPVAQNVLAEHVTKFVHGDEALESALRITTALFSANLDSLTASDFEQLALDGLPSSEISSSESKPLTQLLVEAGLSQSGKFAKDAIMRSAVFINGVACSFDDNLNVSGLFAHENALHGRYFLVKVGKRHHHLFVLKS